MSLRVLFQSHHGIGRMYGGGPSVISNLAAELGKIGVEVTFHDYWKHDPTHFDLVHYFSCYGNQNWLGPLPGDPPLVVTPITWWDHPWKTRTINALKHAARVVRHRTTDRRRLGDPYAMPDHWFPNSEGEAHHFNRAVQVPRSKMTIVPHGVARRFAEGDATRFEQEFGLRDFVLCVGRFEYPRKNQLALVRALKSDDLPLVFIGGPDLAHAAYFDQCQAEAGPNTRFLGPIAHDDPRLSSAYHACKVIVQPALLESPGLSGLEGALGGANVATTEGGSTREYFAEHAWYFDPHDARTIRDAVLSAYHAPRTGAMRARALAHYTWDRIAVTQKTAYEQVLARTKTSRVELNHLLLNRNERRETRG
jgi:glycosyltransferase involved in cell wall biosynthesis